MQSMLHMVMCPAPKYIHICLVCDFSPSLSWSRIHPQYHCQAMNIQYVRLRISGHFTCNKNLPRLGSHRVLSGHTCEAEDEYPSEDNLRSHIKNTVQHNLQQNKHICQTTRRTSLLQIALNIYDDMNQLITKPYLEIHGDETITLAQSPDEGIAHPETGKHDGKASEQLACRINRT